MRGGSCLADAVQKAYLRGESDYKMEPLVLVDKGNVPVGKIRDGDTVIFCCRRGEREIELTDAFTATDFPYFERAQFKALNFVILTMYHEKYKDMPIAFAPSRIEQTLAMCISQAGLTQLHCAESEKFAHVTYFFNGGDNCPVPGEDDLRLASPKGVPFEEVPELSLPAVAEEVKKGLAKGYDFIVVNYANGDVIGHTAKYEAKITCAQVVSRYLGEVVDYAKKQGYVIAVTADHGNLEILKTKTGEPHVAHTTSLVPFVLIDPAGVMETRHDGSLSDIAPTILQLLGVAKPPQMTGRSLLQNAELAANRKVLLVILDGWGLGAQDDSNPIFLANTPAWDMIFADYPSASLRASGDAVGLQPGKAGNSEAGHLNIGAGRVVIQDDVRLDSAIKNGSFEKNAVFLEAIRNVHKNGAALHLLALLSKKSSHGSLDYPLSLLRMAKAEGVQDVFVHLILDGRSTDTGSAPSLLGDLDKTMEEIGIGQIVDAVGRGLALDRDGNFEKIKRVYDALVFGKGEVYF
jgi:2,3-bisphosphoglycerate-independent phosphoglycerate mutase